MFWKVFRNGGPLILNGSYEEAYALFKELGDYKDSEEYLSKFRYVPVKINTTLEVPSEFYDLLYALRKARGVVLWCSLKSLIKWDTVA